MKTIKIIKNAVINISGHGEYYQNDIVANISDEMAEHLVDEALVAEYIHHELVEIADELKTKLIEAWNWGEIVEIADELKTTKKRSKNV